MCWEEKDLRVDETKPKHIKEIEPLFQKSDQSVQLVELNQEPDRQKLMKIVQELEKIKNRSLF